MPDDPAVPNSLSPGVRGRSTAEGDVPERLRRRYYLDGRGGAGLGFYADASVKAPVFRDQGRQLAAARSDPNAIRDMTIIAQHRGWTIVVVRGSPSFRREAWLAGRALGIEVQGYRPTERDVQELDRRIDRRQTRERTEQVRSHARKARSLVEPAERERKRESNKGRDQLRMVEAVVRARVVEPAAQDRILAAARERVSDLVRDGAKFRPLRMGRSAPEADRGRERQR
ncbi:LPD7 domain-containing protein [Phenylobacterium sp.]|uniref:LPD7 domain-containing protein n=1 Tax=Phenylobacterium sp. TaxID=1871053 RepID=UPI002896D834|nr:LPD7 domain-containing protein [Phenylobacterium sp.]